MKYNKLISAFADECESIPYRKSVANVLGSVNAAILFQQMLYNLYRAGNKGYFWKFKEPCQHPWYKVEDSWLEETGFTKRTFDSARDIFATRVDSKAELDKYRKKSDMKYCILYWKDSSNVTYWYSNENAMEKVIEEAARVGRERQLRIQEARGTIGLDPASKEEEEAKSNRDMREHKNAPLLRTENTQENKEEEKEKKEEEKFSFEDTFDSFSREAKEAKKVIPKTGVQKKIAKEQNLPNTFMMAVDFHVENDTITCAKDLGYEPQDVNDEVVKFEHYYKYSKGSTYKKEDWNFHFIYGWLDRGYRLGKLKRNGKLYNEKESPNEERARRLRELSRPGLFAGITD